MKQIISLISFCLTFNPSFGQFNGSPYPKGQSSNLFTSQDSNLTLNVEANGEGLSPIAVVGIGIGLGLISTFDALESKPGLQTLCFYGGVGLTITGVVMLFNDSKEGGYSKIPIH